MNNPLSILFIAIAILLSACNGTEKNTPSESSSETESVEKSVKGQDDNIVSGSFEVNIAGEEYTSTNFVASNTDFTYLYKEEESFVTIRIKGAEKENNILFTYYGPESKIDNPIGQYTDFMFGSQDAESKINLQLMMEGLSDIYNMSYTMVSGTVDISEFGEGEMKVSFEGKGALPRDVLVEDNWVPVSGKIEVNTPHVSKLGND